LFGSSLALPPALTDLTLDHCSRPLTNLPLPPDLTRLEFGHLFDKPLPRLAQAQTLRHLQLGPRYKLDWRPEWNAPNLQTLKLGMGSIEQLQLPPTLQSLEFSHCFNRPIAHLQLPSSLTQLHFGDDSQL